MRSQNKAPAYLVCSLATPPRRDVRVGLCGRALREIRVKGFGQERVIHFPSWGCPARLAVRLAVLHSEGIQFHRRSLPVALDQF